MTRQSFIGILVLAILVLSLFVSGCASSAYYQEGGKSALNLEMPVSGKSKIVFVRPGQFIPLIAKSMHYAIHDGDKLIGILGDSTYFVYECEAGQHLFSCTMQNVSTLEGDLFPGRIYYVRVRPGSQFVTFMEMNAVYPGCPKNLWAKLPAMLRGAEETVITPDAIAHDKTGIENYKEHMNKRLSEPSPDYDVIEKILPEYGQTTSISSK
ncbi:MAG TPA: hypothetical protein VII71_01030 [Verrucomicrobiae bacterium]